MNWAERGWPPQGAPRPPDTPLHGGGGAFLGGVSCRRGVPDAPVTGPPALPGKAGPVRLPSPVRPLLPEPLLGSPTALPTGKATSSLVRSPPLRRSGELWPDSLLYHKCLQLLLPRDRRSIKVCGTSELTVSDRRGSGPQGLLPSKGDRTTQAVPQGARRAHPGGQGLTGLQGQEASGRDRCAQAASKSLECWCPNTILGCVGLGRGWGLRTGTRDA